MARMVVVKFGGSAIGVDGQQIPKVVERIREMKKDARVVAVFSAPLTMQDGRRRSLTDVVLEQGRKAEGGGKASLDDARTVYEKILMLAGKAYEDECRSLIKTHLAEAQNALDDALESGRFADEVRARALAFSGELLMSHIMGRILNNNGIESDSVGLDDWPIITDNNIESTNFLAAESKKRMRGIAAMVRTKEVVTIGGFVGRTVSGTITTYERGGSDRTAADLGILFHKEYDVHIDFEKDSSVVSADPKVVTSHLREIGEMSYNETRLAGMFGMKILDPIAIKEVLENGVDMTITITNLNDPEKTTVIKRRLVSGDGHPIKIVTGRKNCAIFRGETDCVQKLLASLEADKRYGEFVVLSPFTRDGMIFSRILFLDGDYVKRNEKYLRSFDSMASIAYGRGVITLIGDDMWKAQYVASKTSASIGREGLNILNIDAQEETSRILIVLEDAGDNIARAIGAVHRDIALEFGY